LAILFLFGDESGTMPLHDDDKPFVAASVTVLDKKPVKVEKRLFEVLQELSAVPFAAIVQPFPGFGNMIKTKFDKMDVMARAVRIVTGAPEPKKLNDRDIVWAHAMGQAIIHAVRVSTLTTPIEELQILLDQKSMKPHERSLFKEAIKGYMLSTIRMILEGVSPEWESRLRFTAGTTSIHWSDESAEFEGEFGLKLADRLSRKIYRLQTDNSTGVRSVLANAGFEDSVIDVTQVLTRLDQRVVDNFRRITGLPEPREL